MSSMNINDVAVPESFGETPANKGTNVANAGRESKRQRTAEGSHAIHKDDSGEKEDYYHKTVNRPTIQENLERRRLIIKLRSWAATFKKFLGDMMDGKDIENMSYDELVILMEEVKMAVATKNGGVVTTSFAKGAVALGEKFLEDNTSLNVNGPIARVSNITREEDFTDLAKELSLYYAEFIFTHPLHRTLAYLSNAVFQIDAVNTAAKAKMGIGRSVGAKEKEEDKQAGMNSDLEKLRILNEGVAKKIDENVQVQGTPVMETIRL